MTGPVEAVLFDLDDTICTYERSADDILALAFDRVGVDPFFDGAEYVGRLAEFSDAGDDIRDTRRAAFGTFAAEAGHGEAVGEEIADIYTDERDQSNVRFLDGAERALDALTDAYRVGMVTNGDPWMQSQKLAGLGIEDRFEVVVHGGHDAPYKPDPEPFHLALDELGVAPDRTVHVGNSHAADVTGAHAAGLRSVWLADGDRSAALDPEPHHVVESLHDLAEEPWA
ncbi:HAD-superfamily hydrolase, subfamily IA, variant 1 [Halosimplex carlsbadense 2-9-1]|uniref:HAD-superfamily hydrolase, subfamily IA, variant 1 n=1 Tax=Halosimplex carlsbadense 2-9-1 TaxID=797114 RepID=M0CIV6_9EURY|nr:HAD family hydrolase [Halosimplex carlsbadense]ELZ23166.1 HAD-superfamily hydrolase, subfamily IA, variant 1 [Halosimplex carlsbadense 2-9-1]